MNRADDTNGERLGGKSRNVQMTVIHGIEVARQPSTQAFSFRSHDLAQNFVTTPNGIPRTSFGDVRAFRTKPSRVSGRRTPGY